MHSSKPHGGHAAANCGYILAVFLALPSLFAGCAADWEIASHTQTVTDDDDDGCPEWACGSNTAVVNNTPVVELNRDGAAGDGFRILSFHDWPLLTLLDLDIEDGELVGTGLLGVEYRGHDLVGNLVVLEDLLDLSLYAMRIADFGYVDSWTQPVEQVPAYHLQWIMVDENLLQIGSAEEVCGSVLSAGGGTLLADHYAVLVNHERYDPQTKTVSVSGAAADGWFNIACNGSALAKMKLLGYDPEYTDTATTAYTTPAERQATLKMLTADYCGTGTSFTEVGEPLRWYNASGAVTPWAGLPQAQSDEAIWTASGALCLDTPRRQEDDPGIAAAIAAECGAALPSCAPYQNDWQQYGEWRTENPD